MKSKLVDKDGMKVLCVIYDMLIFSLFFIVPTGLLSVLGIDGILLIYMLLISWWAGLIFSRYTKMVINDYSFKLVPNEEHITPLEIFNWGVMGISFWFFGSFFNQCGFTDYPIFNIIFVYFTFFIAKYFDINSK